MELEDELTDSDTEFLVHRPPRAPKMVREEPA
jgi:hypothetical protein